MRIFVKVLPGEDFAYAEECKSVGAGAGGPGAGAEYFVTMVRRDDFGGSVGHFVTSMLTAHVKNQKRLNN